MEGIRILKQNIHPWWQGGGGFTCAALVDGRGAGRQQTHGALQQRQHRVQLHGGHQAGAGPVIGNWYAVLGTDCHTITIE